MPGYRAVGRTGYTYTTARQQQAARSSYAAQANRVAQHASDRANESAMEAEEQEEGSSGTMKIALGLALVGGGVWFISKKKKEKAGKRTPSKSSTTPSGT